LPSTSRNSFDLAAQILIDLNDLQFDFRHLAPHLRAGGGRLREFALQSRRFPRQNREPGDLDKISLEEAPYADQFALDQLDLLGLGLLQGGVAAEFVVELSDTLTELGFLAPARRTPQLEQFSFAVQRGGKFRRWRIFQKFLGNDDVLGAIALAGKPGFPGPHLIEALGDDGEARPQDGLVQPYQRVAETDAVTLPNQQFADDAPRWVLNLFDVGIHDDGP
jgi:hypothetical protein